MNVSFGIDTVHTLTRKNILIRFLIKEQANRQFPL